MQKKLLISNTSLDIILNRICIMKYLKYDVKLTKEEVVTTATLDGLDIDDVIKQAADLAHSVLEELSIYRQRNNLEDITFDCEGEACAFLDLIDD